MKRPTIGCVIATPGRSSLVRTLNSIQYQGLIPGDDILIVGDGHHEPTKDIVELFGPPFRYVAYKKTRDWGHSQQNYGLGIVGGDWLLLQDDDDIFLPRAFDEAREIIMDADEQAPVIGRTMTPYLGLLWSQPGVEPLDGHCLLVPNVKEKLGHFGSEYAGDQLWLTSNLEKYDTWYWADRVWTLTRPTGKLWPRLLPRKLDDQRDEYVWSFYRDVDGMWDCMPIILLSFQRHQLGWKASVISASLNMTRAEYREVVEFAAWAGQGSNVLFELDCLRNESEVNNHILAAALDDTGYRKLLVEETFTQYCFNWPPHRFDVVEHRE